MSKNVWLERAEKKKQAANTVKFKGKFQEAAKSNKGRIYPSYTKEELEAGGKYQVSMSCTCESDAKLEKSIRDIAAEGKAADVMAAAKAVKEAVPDATVIVNCCTRSQITQEEIDERWKPPTDDECGWYPIRPTPEAIKINQDSVKQVSAQSIKPDGWKMPIEYVGASPRFKENDFIDLSAVKGSNSRYKEYDRLRKQAELMEDAMVVYQAGRSEPKNDIKLMEFSIVSEGGEPIKHDDQAALDAGELQQDYDDDVAYFRKKLFRALKMPKTISSQDIAACRKMEEESGESPVDWRELKKAQRLEELKIEVMSKNPQILGVGMPNNFFKQDVPQQVTVGTPIPFHPDQISHHVIGNERRVFSIEVKPENAEKFIEKLKAEFRKKANAKMEALAAESETWFAPNGPNRGNIPSVIDAFADVAAEAYQTLSAKIDNAFLDTTPDPDNAARLATLAGITIHSGDPKMAEHAINLDKLPACETFTINGGEGWNQPGVGQWANPATMSMGC